MIFKLWSPWLLFWVSCTAQKSPPPEFVGPVCDKPTCTRRVINVKMYIEDSLWDRMAREARGNPTELIGKQMDTIFSRVNKHLKNLDNGGFKVDFARDVVKLNRSEIVLEDTYVDRINSNKTTKVDPTNIFSHTFTFQEAVQKLPDRHSTDLRILFIPEKGPDPTLATSEETCICNPEWFGCIAVFSIRFLDNWGHTRLCLPMRLATPWVWTCMTTSSTPATLRAGFSCGAYIWSPEAKRRINNQDNSCLAKDVPSSSIVFPDD
eukprot:GFUD01044328.1.p1 GENE.GFUD01044328.1~~GFUD01044328.1.p1  ORF type:complete len:264 (+),score=58.21 GFUD01044328.1:228-1019(+)